MVTGVRVEADADGTEPIVKKAIVHSAIAAEIILLCRIINLFMFVFIFVCGYLFVCRTALTAIQFRAEPGTIFRRRFEQRPRFG
jgi:hypothetical protein